MRILVLAVMFGLMAVASADETFTFNTIDGRVFKDVSISRIEPSGLQVMTDDGIQRIPFAVLPEDVRKRFNYDPDKAAAHDASVAATQAKMKAEAQAEVAKQVAREQATPTPAPKPSKKSKRPRDEDPADQEPPSKPPLGQASALKSGGIDITPETKRYSIYGRVIQSSSTGILVDAEKRYGTSGYEAAIGVVMIFDTNAPEDSYIRKRGVASGWYDYVTVTGAAKRVPSFRLVP